MVRHSRFIAHAARVQSPDDAMAFLAASADHAATHNCWAWRIGAQYRSSDDGEPGGTAGRPILAAIDSQAMDEVAVLVVRWYGGIKLGVGGLARAYGGAAAECLRTALREPLLDMATLRVACNFADAAQVHAALGPFGARKLEEVHAADGVRFTLALPQAQSAPLQAWLRDATRDRARCMAGDTGDLPP